MFKAQLIEKLKKGGIFALETTAAYVVMLVVADNTVTPTICYGPSMDPTIDPRGELAFVNMFSPKYSKDFEFKRGDVVIARLKDKKVCKRIRALEGDIVFVRSTPYEVKKVILQPGEVWLQGDNASNSYDSRMYGPLPKDSLVGPVIWKFNWWSSPHFGPVDQKNFDYRNLNNERNNNTQILLDSARLNDNGEYVDATLSEPFPDPAVFTRKAISGIVAEVLKESRKESPTISVEDDTKQP